MNDLMCEYQTVRIPTCVNTNRTLNLELFSFMKQPLCKVKEMDLYNIEIYQTLTFDIICSYNLSFPQYPRVFLNKPRPCTISKYTVRKLPQISQSKPNKSHLIENYIS